MKILVLGASGGIGKHIVRIAAEKGHQVSAVVRTNISFPTNVAIHVGDLQSESFLLGAMSGQDVILSALGIRRASENPFGKLISPPDFCSSSARNIVSAAKKAGIKRIIAVSASGVGDSSHGLNFMMRFLIATSKIGAMYRDLNAMESVYSQSNLDYCCVRPTGLTDAPQTNQWKQICNFPLTARISRADVAAWMVNQAESKEIADRFPIITG